MIDDPTTRLVKQGAEAVSHNLGLALAHSTPAHTPHLHQQKAYKAIMYPSPIPHASSSSSAPSASTSSPLPPTAVLLKHRFPKQYRHPTLDAQLTKQRLTAEARALVRCRKMGVCVPGLRVVDVRRGVLGIEWVEGWSVREVLGGGQEEDEGAHEGEDEDEEEGGAEGEEDPEDVLKRVGVSQGECGVWRSGGPGRVRWQGRTLHAARRAPNSDLSMSTLRLSVTREFAVVIRVC